MKKNIEPYCRTANLDFIAKGLLAELHFWYKGAVSVHSHDYYEFVIVTKGEMVHNINGKSKVISAKTFVFLKPGDVHYFHTHFNKKSENINISIEKGTFDTLCEVIAPNFSKQIEKIAEPYFILNDILFNYINYLANSINTYSMQQAFPIIKLLLLNILIPTVNESFLNSDSPEWFTFFMQEISSPEIFVKPLSSIYELAPINRVYLTKYFKNITGKTIIQFITDKKINYACGLLKNTNYSIAYIASMINYNSIAHFSRTFKEITGFTPMEYRKGNS